MTATTDRTVKYFRTALGGSRRRGESIRPLFPAWNTAPGRRPVAIVTNHLGYAYAIWEMPADEPIPASAEEDTRFAAIRHDAAALARHYGDIEMVTE